MEKKHGPIKARFELLRSMRQEKDPETSAKKREVGNKAFVSGDLHTAMVNYSKAVVLASEKTQELASAYANRLTNVNLPNLST